MIEKKMKTTNYPSHDNTSFPSENVFSLGYFDATLWLVIFSQPSCRQVNLMALLIRLEIKIENVFLAIKKISENKIIKYLLIIEN